MSTEKKKKVLKRIAGSTLSTPIHQAYLLEQLKLSNKYVLSNMTILKKYDEEDEKQHNGLKSHCVSMTIKKITGLYYPDFIRLSSYKVADDDGNIYSMYVATFIDTTGEHSSVDVTSGSLDVLSKYIETAFEYRAKLRCKN
jgi:hypothetical protein